MRSAADRRKAIGLYRVLLGQPVDADFWSSSLRQQVFLGSDEFVAAQLRKADALGSQRLASVELPRAQRRWPGSSFRQLIENGVSRGAARRQAYTLGAQTMTELPREVGLSVSRVSRLIGGEEAKGNA